MAHRVAPQAAEDLDKIWLHVAQDSGSIDVANRLVESSERPRRLAEFPRRRVRIVSKMKKF